MDDGIEGAIEVTPIAGSLGSLLPIDAVVTAYDDHAEFGIVPDPGYVPDKVEGCGGERCEGVDMAQVFVTEAVLEDYFVTATFVAKPAEMLVDGFEP